MKAAVRGGLYLLGPGVLWLCACGSDALAPLLTTTDEFKQNTAAKIDVLWTVDDSPSMAEEQAGLGQSFQGFIDTLIGSRVDYHIGVISTDPSDEGALHADASPAFIDTAATDPKAQFLRNVRVGTEGSRLEKAFESTALALGLPPTWQVGDAMLLPPRNAGFLRHDAALFIIMVSDEDDKSFGPVGYYRRLFESLKGKGNEGLVSVSAIVGDPSYSSVGANGAPLGGCFDAQRGSALAGDRYVDLAMQTGGIYTSLCSDFNESLQRLSLAAAGLQSVFELSKRPDLTASIDCGAASYQRLCVRVDGAPIAENNTQNAGFGWRFDASLHVGAVVFLGSSVPKPQSKITIEYREQP